MANNILGNNNGGFSERDPVAESSRLGGKISAPTPRPQGLMTTALLQDVIDASAANIVILDENRNILHVNRAWRHFATRTGSLIDQFGIGYKYPEFCLGTVATSLADAKRITDGIESVILRKEIKLQTEYKCTALSEPVWFRLHAESFLLRDHNSSTVVLVTHDDITAEQLAKESLIEARERIDRLWGTTNILPWEADAKSWEFTFVGEQAEQMLGYPMKMWFKPDFWINHIHPQDRAHAVAECSRLLQTDDQYQFEYRMIAKDGRIIWINDIVTVQRENGQPLRLSGFMVDVTERKQAEDTLRLLGGRLIAAQEEERRRIARDLHDDLNQQMALLSIELDQVGQMLDGEKAEAADRVRRLQQKAMGISTDIHRLSYTLHPSKLDHLGLVPALKSFCEELSKNRGVDVGFSYTGFPAAISPDITLCIFRVAQEGLQNAAKHSQAANLEISLRRTEENIELTISDNGCGFDMNSGKLTQGLGFISMKERLRLVNGIIKIRSEVSKGTEIRISVPLHNSVVLHPV